jgi:chemotaxis protein methyltransferase CheR
MSFNPISIYKAELEVSDFVRISKYIGQNFGIKLPDHKRIMLQGRLISRLIKLNFESFKEYTDYVFSEEGKMLELQNMIDVISTNKTDFFREPLHFDFLKNKVLPEFVEKNQFQNLNIWSAACSSGEEVYSLAIVVEDFFADKAGFYFSILGTDISTRMLEKAKTAIYPSSSIAAISMEIKKKYFLKSKDSKASNIRIKQELRSKTSFQWQNLMDNDYALNKTFDIIFCRNVLIYFSKQDQMHVIKNLSQKLKPGGYLFLGHSESISHFDLPLISVSQTVFQKL